MCGAQKPIQLNKQLFLIAKTADPVEL